MGSVHLLNYPCHLPDWMPSPSHAIISYDWYLFFLLFIFKLSKGKGWGCEGKVWSSNLLKREFYTHVHLDYVRVKFLFCIKKNLKKGGKAEVWTTNRHKVSQRMSLIITGQSLES